MNANPNTTARPVGPNRHRLAVLVLVFVYPLITAILYVLGPFTATWQVWERTLILAPAMVALMVYGLIPFLTKRFRGFLIPGAKGS